MKKTLSLITIAFIAASCDVEVGEDFCPGLDCSSVAVTFSTYFSDDFNRANESPVASPWNFVLVGSDSIDLVSNEIQPVDTNAIDVPSMMHTTVIPSTRSRVSLSARVAGAGYDGEMLLYMRSQSDGDILDTYFCGVNPSTNRLSMGKNISGAGTSLGESTGTMAFDNGDNFTLTFTAIDDSLTCELTGSDELSVSATDSTFPSGLVGFGGGDNGNNVLFIDDFLAEIGD